MKTLTYGHGIIHFVSTVIRGVPPCHGAGGMSGYVSISARTGGALVMLGLFVAFTGLFLSDSVTVLFHTMLI